MFCYNSTFTKKSIIPYYNTLKCEMLCNIFYIYFTICLSKISFIIGVKSSHKKIMLDIIVNDKIWCWCDIKQDEQLCILIFMWIMLFSIIFILGSYNFDFSILENTIFVFNQTCFILIIVVVLKWLTTD